MAILVKHLSLGRENLSLIPGDSVKSWTWWCTLAIPAQTEMEGPPWLTGWRGSLLAGAAH